MCFFLLIAGILLLFFPYSCFPHIFACEHRNPAQSKIDCGIYNEPGFLYIKEYPGPGQEHRC